MKNRKGFTLIEMLLVVAVLGLLGVIITISLTKTLQDTNQKKCDDFILEVEDAACVYASLSDREITCVRSNCPPIPLRVLIEEGLVTSEVDGCTNNEINLEETVTVTWNENGEKQCVYNGVKEYAK